MTPLIRVEKAHLLSALKFQAKNDPRYYLCGVYFDSDGSLVSTDGHRIFVGKHSGIAESTILKFIGHIPKRFEYANIDIKNELINYYDDNGVRLDVGIISVVDGRYPDWRRVINKPPTRVSEIGFNGDYVSDVFHIAKLFSAFSRVKINFTGNESGARFEFNSNAYAVVMPMKL